MAEKEVREKLIRYQLLENQAKAFIERRNFLLTKIMEIDSTIDSLGEVEKNKGKEIFLPLGSGIHIPGILNKTNKMMVEIGASVATECTTEKAKEILNKRKEIIESGLQRLEKDIMNLGNELSRLQPEIENMLKKPKSSSNLEVG
jgi:prefoldin alpha subunit